MQRINSRDIVQGKPLPFDCYDRSGVLLLRRGQIIGSEKQLAALVERGLFAAAGAAPPESLESQHAKTPFAIMSRCKDEVRRLFARIRSVCGDVLPSEPSLAELAASYRQALADADRARATDFPQHIMNVARGIQVLCRIDEDAAIGAVHLDAVCRYTTIHALHKALLAELVASRLGIPPQERLPIIAAALTANISIISLQETLHAANRKPTDAERLMIRMHPQLSVEMLLELGVRDDVWLEAVLQHHERPDGSGYPCALKNDNICRGAQILALADVYCTMVKPRRSRDGLPAKDVLRSMFLARGNMAADDITQVFIRTLGVYPPGSFVRLQNGETAIVVRRGKSPGAPQVKTVRDPQGMPLACIGSRDTAHPTFAIRAGIPRDRLMAINFNALWDYGIAF